MIVTYAMKNAAALKQAAATTTQDTPQPRAIRENCAQILKKTPDSAVQSVQTNPHNVVSNRLLTAKQSVLWLLRGGAEHAFSSTKLTCTFMIVSS